jgi:hypothetical protein
VNLKGKRREGFGRKKGVVDLDALTRDVGRLEVNGHAHVDLDVGKEENLWMDIEKKDKDAVEKKGKTGAKKGKAQSKERKTP